MTLTDFPVLEMSSQQGRRHRAGKVGESVEGAWAQRLHSQPHFRSSIGACWSTCGCPHVCTVCVKGACWDPGGLPGPEGVPPFRVLDVCDHLCSSWRTDCEVASGS